MRIDIENSRWLSFVEIDSSITKRWGTNLNLLNALKGELTRASQDLANIVNMRFAALMISDGDSIECSPYLTENPINPEIGIKVSFKSPENKQEDMGTFVVTFSGLKSRSDDQERISGEVSLSEDISALAFQYGCKIYMSTNNNVTVEVADAFRRSVHDSTAGFLSGECQGAGVLCDITFFKGLTHILSLSLPDSIKFAKCIADLNEGYQGHSIL